VPSLDDDGESLRLLFEFLEDTPGLDPALSVGLGAVEQEQYTHTHQRPELITIQ